MYFLFSLVLLLFPVSTSFGSNPCNCEKILKEGECNDPDCIKICNLENVFDSAGKLIKNKCLKGTKTIPEYKVTDIRANEIEDHLEESNEEYKEIKEENEKKIQKNCPGCNISAKMKALMTPVIKKEGCDKYINTDNFKQWREEIDKKSTYCTPQTDNDGIPVPLSLKTRTLCKSNEEYLHCCPSQYLNKSYKLKYTLKHEDKPEKCTEDHEEEIQIKIRDYMIEVMQGNSSSFSKKIFQKCPDGCSFDATVNSLKINTDCSGTLDLSILCSHKAKRKGNGFFSIALPVYNIKVTYDEDIKCQNKK